MLAVWTFIKGSFSFIVKNWGWIATVAMVLFLFLFMQQCKSTRIAKAETEEAKRIADNNLKALKDSTIMLKVTREQLSLVDANLDKLVKRYDSLKRNPKVIIITRPEYVPKNVTVPNTLVRDSVDKSKYGLAFDSKDSVRTIQGTSWFNLYETANSVDVKAGNTVFTNFELNFGLAFNQYDDKKNKMTRISVEPYYVDDKGNFTKPISECWLNMHYRGAELLTVPYQENAPPDQPKKHKWSVRSGFSLNVNLVSYGYTPLAPTPNLNWVMPSVGVGYSFVLVRNK